MEDLQQQLQALADEHGTDAIESTLADIKASGRTSQCPRGQIWNGTECVPDIGN